MKTCNRCVMDETCSDIVFFDVGCNFCNDFTSKHKKLLNQKNLNDHELNSFHNKVKSKKQYDCIIGVSGGVDSSYVLYLAVKAGLKPLAVHLDNGWNSELATSNINNLVNILGVDLYTHVIDWEENRSLQRSFMSADVVDIEMLMDNAMLALNFRLAEKFNIKHILSGSNTSTEGMRMPHNWNWLKFDATNIKSINKKYNNVKISTHKLISIPKYLYYMYVRGIKWVHYLDYYDYKKDEAVNILVKEVDYKPYPYKHYESVFTRFYQGYILPKKFGIDKRKLHLSTLIISGQMTREQAVEILKTDPYPDATQLEKDYKFVTKKLGLSDTEFTSYLNRPRVEHDFYSSERWIWNFLLFLRKTIYG